MQVNPYLNFHGQCEAALAYYEQHLGAKTLAKFTFVASKMAEQVGPEWADKIMHARILVGDIVIMGSDGSPNHIEETKGMSISITVEDPAEAERIFDALSANGKVEMPIQQTFWAVRFGMLVDQFGIPWMVNCGG